jgi:hypothetical protein
MLVTPFFLLSCVVCRSRYKLSLVAAQWYNSRLCPTGIPWPEPKVAVLFTLNKRWAQLAVFPLGVHGLLEKEKSEEVVEDNHTWTGSWWRSY